MWHIPDEKYFRAEEFFPPQIVESHYIKNGEINPTIWRLIDSRVTWTAQQLRKLFGPMIINDWVWGGDFENRGYRDPISLIDWEEYAKTGIIQASWSSFTSQHCLGQAVDSSFRNELVTDIRQYIIEHKNKEEFKYITAIEKEVTWLHYDVRNFKIPDQRFFIF